MNIPSTSFLREAVMVPVISFVGRSDCGKTTYLEKLIPELKCRGYCVAVVKHDVHGFEMDTPGKDTWRHARAGADVVCISSPERAAMIRRVNTELTLMEVCEFCRGADIILTEGYKREAVNAVEVFRREHCGTPLAEAGELLAMVSDTVEYPETPTFPLNNPAPLADLFEERFLRPSRKTAGTGRPDP
jgi:molybdopterin-guanine dinucleotide biosynthesis protein B